MILKYIFSPLDIKQKKTMAKKVNPWTAHVKEVSKQNPGMKFMDVLKKAKASYKKQQHGGSALGGSLSPSSVPAGGGRSSGTALQIDATQVGGGKKSKRRGSKRSSRGSKRSSRGSKRSSRGTKRRSRGGMSPLTPGDLKHT
jgi:hypothetical protein